jgi:hypothetical protein
MKPSGIFCVAAFLACVLPTGTPASTADDYLPVSLMQLIASPERYDGKVVRIIGFVHLEFEGNAIYLHREDYEHGITANGLWLDRPKCLTRVGGKPFTSGYALVEGVFKAQERGHMELFSGTISYIVRCQRWGP